MAAICDVCGAMEGVVDAYVDVCLECSVRFAEGAADARSEVVEIFDVSDETLAFAEIEWSASKQDVMAHAHLAFAYVQMGLCADALRESVLVLRSRHAFGEQAEYAIKTLFDGRMLRDRSKTLVAKKLRALNGAGGL